ETEVDEDDVLFLDEIENLGGCHRSLQVAVGLGDASMDANPMPQPRRTFSGVVALGLHDPCTMMVHETIDAPSRGACRAGGKGGILRHFHFSCQIKDKAPHAATGDLPGAHPAIA